MHFPLHHLGMVVESIDAAAAIYAQRFGYERQSPVYEDPVQAALVQFWRLPGAREYLEFISPNGPQSHLHEALKKGRRLNHLCYVADDIEAACQRLREDGMFVVQSPVEAVAFRPRRIAWLMGRDGIPIELVEAGDDAWPAD